MDRVQVQVRFRKGIFTCKCGQEDIVDFNVNGGNTYEHSCSVCGAWNNSFVNYDGCATFTQEEYEKKSQKDIDQVKDAMLSAWNYDRKNPPPYIEPTKEDLENEKASYETRIAELSMKIAEKEEIVKEGVK